MLIDKLIFLQHGGGSTVITPGQQVPAGTSPIAAIVIAVILIAIIVGLWFLLARKKSF